MNSYRENSCENWSCWPSENLPGISTSSSPARRLRQANAQPCLSPATNDGSDGREDHVAQRGESLRTEHASGAQHGSAGSCRSPAMQAVGDRGGGAEHDHEQDRALAQLEEDDREREPCDRRHRLEPGDHRADRGPQHAGCGRPRRRSRCRARSRAEPDDRRVAACATPPPSGVPNSLNRRFEHGDRTREHVAPASIRSTRRTAR